MDMRSRTERRKEREKGREGEKNGVRVEIREWKKERKRMVYGRREGRKVKGMSVRRRQER